MRSLFHRVKAVGDYLAERREADRFQPEGWETAEGRALLNQYRADGVGQGAKAGLDGWDAIDEGTGQAPAVAPPATPPFGAAPPAAARPAAAPPMAPTPAVAVNGAAPPAAPMPWAPMPAAPVNGAGPQMSGPPMPGAPLPAAPTFAPPTEPSVGRGVARVPRQRSTDVTRPVAGSRGVARVTTLASDDGPPPVFKQSADPGSNDITDHGSNDITDHGSNDITDHGSSEATDHGSSEATPPGSGEATRPAPVEGERPAAGDVGRHRSTEVAPPASGQTASKAVARHGSDEVAVEVDHRARHDGTQAQVDSGYLLTREPATRHGGPVGPDRARVLTITNVVRGPEGSPLAGAIVTISLLADCATPGFRPESTIDGVARIITPEEGELIAEWTPEAEVVAMDTRYQVAELTEEWPEGRELVRSRPVSHGRQD